MTNNTINQIIEQISQLSQDGNRKELRSVLRTLMNNRHLYYHQSTDSSLLEGYADGLYKTLFLELDEEENESIETAELAYVALSNLISSSHAAPEHYKRRLLLLHYFYDYFTDSIIEVFLKNYRKEHMLEARNLALECIEKMQLADMYYLEDNVPEFIDGDEQISDACNDIEIDINLSDEEQEKAKLLHKVMHAYLKNKYKKD